MRSSDNQYFLGLKSSGTAARLSVDFTVGATDSSVPSPWKEPSSWQDTQRDAQSTVADKKYFVFICVFVLIYYLVKSSSGTSTQYGMVMTLPMVSSLPMTRSISTGISEASFPLRREVRSTVRFSFNGACSSSMWTSSVSSCCASGLNPKTQLPSIHCRVSRTLASLLTRTALPALAR